jgi:hypothetical protein
VVVVVVAVMNLFETGESPRLWAQIAPECGVNRDYAGIDDDELGNALRHFETVGRPPAGAAPCVLEMQRLAALQLC